MSEVLVVLKKLPSKNSVLNWPTCLAVFGFVVLFSSVDKSTFLLHYREAINFLPLPDTLRSFARTHYKLGHPICYAILAIVTVRCLQGRYAITLALTFLLGLALEITQHFLPSRSGSAKDLMYNLSGIVAGLFIVMLFTAAGAYSGESGPVIPL